MHLSAISLFELGQFLRIFLWIFLPIFILAILITSYIHYRKRRNKKERDDTAREFLFDEDDPAILARVYSDAETRPEDGNTAYKGLLWLKDKYEKEREQSTEKYMQLKEEHRQLKEKFEELEDNVKKGKGSASITPEPVPVDPESFYPSLNAVEGEKGENGALREELGVLRGELIETASLRDLLAEKNLQVAFLQNQLDQRINSYHHLERQGRETKERLAEWETRHPQTQELLNERQTMIDSLREQLQQEIRKTTEVKAKLESGGHLLLKIHQELDQLLTKDAPKPAIAENPETNRITAWEESDTPKRRQTSNIGNVSMADSI